MVSGNMDHLDVNIAIKANFVRLNTNQVFMRTAVAQTTMYFFFKTNFNWTSSHCTGKQIR